MTSAKIEAKAAAMVQNAMVQGKVQVGILITTPERLLAIPTLGRATWLFFVNVLYLTNHLIFANWLA